MQPTGRKYLSTFLELSRCECYSFFFCGYLVFLLNDISYFGERFPIKWHYIC